MNPNITIGITDCGKKWPNYAAWISRNNDRIKVVKLTHHDNNISDAAKFSGLVLTGGPDVHPKFFNKPEYVSNPNYHYTNAELDEKRDLFERKIIDLFLKQNKPILGICRGLQLMNVHLGGTLIPHLPYWDKQGHSKVDGADSIHGIQIKPGSLLHKITAVSTATVNSAHHQAAKRIADNLKVTAESMNGVVEALEWENQDNKPFFLCVQWHPERMKDIENPCTKNIRFDFLNNCELNLGMPSL